MAYNVFISYTDSDRPLAAAIEKVLKDAFEGEVRFFLAAHQLSAGDEWKRLIRQRLQDCDAIISVITDQSVSKPWIFIEWSAFWLQDKKSYTLISDNIKITSLVAPMQDRQIITMTDVEQVKTLIRALSADSGYPRGTPFERAEEFVTFMRQAIATRDQTLADSSYAPYRDSLLGLPTEDADKQKIARWFYLQGELEVARRITAEIRDELVKAEMAVQLIRIGDLDNARIVAEYIRAADRLGTVARALIDYSYVDADLLQTVLNDMLTKNQAEVRNICRYLISLGLHESLVFSATVNQFRNMAELRNVAIAMVDNHLEQDAFDLYRAVIMQIAKQNQKEAENALRHAVAPSPNVVRAILDEPIITNPACRERLLAALDGAS